MDECIDALGESALLCTLEANSRYCQMECDDEDKDETAILSHQGLYRCT